MTSRLLKDTPTPVSTPTHPPILTKAVEGDRRSISDSKMASIVQDVFRSVCYGERSRVSANGDNGSSRNGVDPCVATVVQSISNQRLEKPFSTSNGAVDDDSNKVDDGQQLDDFDPPPKLTAVNEEDAKFDQFRYRRRRKRRFFSRRPTRRCPIKLTPATDDVQGLEAVQRPRRKRVATEDTKMDTTARVETKKSIFLDARIHDSVFAPDRCHLAKTSKRRGVNHFETNGTNHLCWHSSLNEKLLPNVISFKDGDIKCPATWTTDMVSDFVRLLPGCPPAVANKFRDEQIDGEAFMLLTQSDIITLMNIRLGPAVKIYNAIMLLKHYKSTN